jgi:hypothetical protein
MKIEMFYYQGRKDMNDFLRACDLYQEGEGVFIAMKATLTLKKGTKPTQKWKDKVIKAFTEVNEKLGFEVTDFEFKQIL